MPFINPEGFKKTLAAVLMTESDHLRLFGAVAIVAGVGLLYAVR